MKRILITGANSYIGTSFEKWLQNYQDTYSVETIDLKNESWKMLDFSHYDCIFHVAGIAHVSTDPKMEDLYFKVNRDLTIETAIKAKTDGIKQFIFMSSIIVYGNSPGVEKVIDRNTRPDPSNFYGKSKLEAEEGLNLLASAEFKIATLRPPMIYGRGSKGNYPKLAKSAKFLPIFPEINNRRSMLHIDNLCEFIRKIIDNDESGIFFPQNEEYVETSQMVKLIAEAHGREIRLVKVFNPIIRLMSGKIGIINRVFGSLIYEENMSLYKENYRIRSLKESILLTEK